ncbi:hypothetical protein TELCIR_17885 [Teladorsagia circumcincta]|uniref:Uncharacterized protein n=1 Tax=Teladorsagia circumcincta TaxID=45464 RepID=A0A2G9TRK0_TELCI|nr:hypothetical protein TELCIR_17885 [Teladorsagia circumcincta]
MSNVTKLCTLAIAVIFPWFATMVVQTVCGRECDKIWMLMVPLVFFSGFAFRHTLQQVKQYANKQQTKTR